MILVLLQDLWSVYCVSRSSCNRATSSEKRRIAVCIQLALWTNYTRASVVFGVCLASSTSWLRGLNRKQSPSVIIPQKWASLSTIWHFLGLILRPFVAQIWTVCYKLLRSPYEALTIDFSLSARCRKFNGLESVSNAIPIGGTSTGRSSKSLIWQK